MRQTAVYGALLTVVLLAAGGCPRVAAAQTVDLGAVELTIAASLVGVNVALGAYCWKSWAARTEA